MDSSEDVRPRKEPRQQRARFLVEAMLDAAARILEQDGLEAFNTNRVAEVAGVSVGSLYQYFPNKQAIIAAVIARSQDDLAGRIEAAQAAAMEGTLAQGVGALVRVVMAYHSERPRLAAALEYQEQTLPVNDTLQAASARIHRSVVAVLAAHDNAIKVADHDNAAQDLMTITKAMIDRTVLAGMAVTADLQARVIRAALGYLTWVDCDDL